MSYYLHYLEEKKSRLKVKSDTQHFNFDDRKAKHRQLTIKNHPSYDLYLKNML